MDASQDIRTKTGGAYIPPARLRMMQQNISDKISEPYQRLAWEAQKKSINGLINKVNIANIGLMVRKMFQINLIRCRGLFCRAIMRAQMSSPTFTQVYAALVSVCNSKFPTVGSLLLKRLIVQFRQSYQHNDKQKCINTVRFIGHLVNQSMAHELIALEILFLLLTNASNDSVEVALALLKECGAKLEDVAQKSIAAIFERLRNALHDGELNKRVQYMIEVMFALRKDKFKDYPPVAKELDLVEESDQNTHTLELEDEHDLEERLNVFKLDDKFAENEARYEQIKKDILGDDSVESFGSGGSESENDDEYDDGSDDEVGKEGDPTGTTDSNVVIIDKTETNLIALRKTLYLTIQSSLDYEECAHKLLKLDLQPEHYPELCAMIVDCCAQQRTYVKFYGLLGQRFCQINAQCIKSFEELFTNCYDTIHRFESGKLRNVANLFGHLLFTDVIPWTVLSTIRLNEHDTTSSSRVFIKILFQQLAESLGLVKLNCRIKDATLHEAFEGLFPRDEPQNTRFAINFFTSIGLGGLTDDLREHLKTAAVTKQPASGLEKKVKKEEITSSDDSSSSSSSDSSSASSSTSDEDSDIEKSSESDISRYNRKRNRKQHSKPSSSTKKRRLSPKRNENSRKRDSHRESRSDRHRKGGRKEEEDFGRRERVRQEGHDERKSPYVRDHHRARERTENKRDYRRHL